ncbi:MAG: glycosyltransferase [Polaromonas sp.]|nr:glycosyltransferase [Polaromonas sp.]
MKTSFIVLTYNRTDALLPVLKSLARQCGPDHEVLIADDGSRPSEVALLEAQCPAFACPVRHVWHSDKGFTAAAARNLGAHLASGDYLVFLDGDCIPNRSFVAAHDRLAEKGRFVNGSRVLLGARLTEEAIAGRIDLLDQGVAFWLRARLTGDSNKLLHMVSWPYDAFRVQNGFHWRGIRSCNLGVWRDDFVAVNGFDETFEGWGHEDADLVLRLVNLGRQRTNGFLATEVYHLWHRENPRDHESVNKRRVLERMSTGLVRATKGLNELGADPSVQVTTLF